MLYVRCVGLTKDVVCSLAPSSQATRSHPEKSKELWTKGLEWNNAAYEEKEKYHYFTHPAQDYTNSHPHFNKSERMRTWETEETNTRSKKKEKTGGK